jgi:hypothetical protein
MVLYWAHTLNTHCCCYYCCYCCHLRNTVFHEQTAWRATKQQRLFVKQRDSATRIQRAIKAFVRNAVLARQVQTAFKAAAEGQVNAVAAIIKTVSVISCCIQGC